MSLPVFGRSAEPGPPSFELIPQPGAGDELHYSFERRVLRGGAVLQWYRMPLLVQVVEAGPGGALLRWAGGAATIVDVDPRYRPVLEAGLAVMRDVALDIQADECGQPVALHNAVQVHQHCLAMVDRIGEALAADPATRPVAEALTPLLKTSFTTEAVVAAASLKEPRALLGAMGHRFGAEQAVEYRTVLDNPFGGPAVPAIARFSVRGVDTRRQQADLSWLMASDPAALTAMGQAVVGHAPALELDERGDYVIDTRTAWPVSATITRKVVAGEQVQVDTTSFTRG
jgi:hypothetical protein